MAPKISFLPPASPRSLSGTGMRRISRSKPGMRSASLGAMCRAFRSTPERGAPVSSPYRAGSLELSGFENKSFSGIESTSNGPEEPRGSTLMSEGRSGSIRSAPSAQALSELARRRGFRALPEHGHRRGQPPRRRWEREQCDAVHRDRRPDQRSRYRGGRHRQCQRRHGRRSRHFGRGADLHRHGE